MGLISAVPIDYRTFVDRRLPRIGVYYVFDGRRMGICTEFGIDIGDIRNSGDEVVSSREPYLFRHEEEVLDGAERHSVQAIRTNVVDGVSFRRLSSIISQIHFRDFLDRHDWLKSA